MKVVTDAYKNDNPKWIENTFLQLLKCMESSMMVNGGNHYKQPHIQKQRHEHHGNAITKVYCSQVTFNLAHNIVNEG